MSEGPRPTIEQVKAAMSWWNSMPQPERMKIRSDMNVQRHASTSASTIARHWLAINCPEPLKPDTDIQ